MKKTKWKEILVIVFCAIGILAFSSQAITNVTGKPVTLFRPPYGDYNDNLINTLDSMGIKTICNAIPGRAVTK